MRTTIATALACAVMALAAPATAEGLLDWSVGAKGGGGGDVWLTPDSVPAWAASQDFFTTTRGGWTYGGGVFAELRILKFLGVEVDFLFFQDVVKQDTTRSRSGVTVATTEERFEWTTLRIPILVKGVLPLGIVRLWVGVGPEFAVPLASSGSIGLPAGASTDVRLKTRTETDVYLAAALGLVIEIGPIGIPIDLRFGWNATQPRGYEDLVTIDAQGNVVQSFTVRASNTIDARLLVGVAYEF